MTEPVRDCVTVRVDNTGGSSPWRRLFLAYSARQEETAVSLPGGTWELLADGTSSFLWQDPEEMERRFTLAPVSAAIFGQR